MRLIFMRHGKAEERSERLADRDRALTFKGRRDLNQHLPSFARYLRGTDECHIWSSDFRRARETAEILVRYMPQTEIIEKPYIATGELKPLLDDLANVNDKATVVVIGHEPYLSEWIETLSRRRTHLKKGSVELLMLKADKPTEAVRMGALELKEMQILEPLDMPFGVGMKEIFLNNQRRILELKDHLMDDVENDEALHQLRVAMRRQRGLFSFVENSVNKKSYRAAQKAYSALMKDLAHLRELDVLLETIHEAKRWELEPLVPLIMAERNSESLRLDIEFSNPASDDAYSEAYNLIQIALSTMKTNTILSDYAEKNMPRNYARLVKRAKAVRDSSDPKVLHEFRVRCKHHRYLYEQFASMAFYRTARRYALLKQLQKVIGNYCDTFYNVETLKSITKDNTNPKVERAVHLYEELQTKERAKHEAAMRPLINAMIDYN